MRRSLKWVCFVGVALLCLPVLPRKSYARKLGREQSSGASLTSVQRVVDELCANLSLPSRVRATLVPSNPLIVSVARGSDADSFDLAIEASFARNLSDTELRAVVAHELGHVWIFTHHPFIHTEELANQIAMRLVTREALDAVYDKVWNTARRAGNIAYFPTR